MLSFFLPSPSAEPFLGKPLIREVLFTFCCCNKDQLKMKGLSWFARWVRFHCASTCCECPQSIFWTVKLLMVLVLEKLLLASEVNTLSVLLFCFECRDFRNPQCVVAMMNKFPQLRAVVVQNHCCFKYFRIWIKTWIFCLQLLETVI